MQVLDTELLGKKTVLRGNHIGDAELGKGAASTFREARGRGGVSVAEGINDDRVKSGGIHIAFWAKKRYPVFRAALQPGGDEDYVVSRGAQAAEGSITKSAIRDGAAGRELT
jgi:hypothetical protein